MGKYYHYFVEGQDEEKLINFLKRSGIVSRVLCVTQVKNLEDEFLRSCNIRKIRELTGSKSDKDFKHDLT